MQQRHEISLVMKRGNSISAVAEAPDMATDDGVCIGHRTTDMFNKKTSAQPLRPTHLQNKALSPNPQREKCVQIRRKYRKVNKFSRRRTNENKKQPKTTVNDAGNMI